MMIVMRRLGRLRVDGMELHRLFIQAGGMGIGYMDS